MTPLTIALGVALLALVLYLLARRAPADELQAALEEAHRYHEQAARIIQRANRQNRPVSADEWGRYHGLMARGDLAAQTYDQRCRERQGRRP